jgi:glutathione-specific gamma-glutamylcyclotransferase
VSVGPGQQTLWVFAYGSLMWQPGFPYVEARRARLEGYHRAFCIYSLHYRGTQQRPGLVLGLARGGTCEGIAFRVADEDSDAVRAYLHARELIYGVYREARLPADLVGEGQSRRINVLTYIAEPGHPSFAGDVSFERRSAVIRAARGKAGSNLVYFVATLRKLRELGIRQADLERLAVQAGVGGRFATSLAIGVLEGRCRAFAMKRGASCSPVRNERRHAFAYRRRLPS